MKTAFQKHCYGSLILWCLGWSQVVLAQTGSLPLQASEAATEQSSYAARITNRKGVHEVDPNVYVYGAEFAKRFQMPQEWVSDELKGVDAVAFRVVPGYKTCGWGGNPQVCRDDEVRCEMDLYFDHQRNPLPWDDRMKSVQLDRRHLSADFIASIANPLARAKGTLIATYRTPFTDPKSGKELGWQAGFSNAQRSGSSFMSLVSYDRELFAKTSLIVLSGGCASEFIPEAIWLNSSQIGIKERGSAYKFFDLPAQWIERVKQLLAQNDLRSNAFFKEQGEKALKALKEAPVPGKSIVPLQ
jgi:hypothetical protein